MTSTKSGVTFVEIMLGVLIMAVCIVPLSRMISSQSSGTKFDRAETEAMQYACDLMDHILMKMEYNPGNIASDTAWVNITRGDTDIRYMVYVREIPWTNIRAPKIMYHPPCPNGVEKNTLDATQVVPEDKDLRLLDKETIDAYSIGAGNSFDLCDIKLIVDYKPTGTADSNWGKRPIILYSRKARL